MVTFDNWHSAGYGDDVVVIYGSGGETIRSFGLEDLISENHLAALPRSVSSIWWGGEHAFSEESSQLILKIVEPGAEAFGDDVAYLALAIDLPDGTVKTQSNQEWTIAQETAGAVADERRQAELTERIAFAAPLRGPSNGTVTDWHHYLTEAFNRMDPDWPDGSARRTVLYPAEHERHERSVGWAREALKEEQSVGSNLMFASPSEEVLTNALVDLAQQIEPAALNGVRIYVAVNDENSAQIESAFASTGADYVQLDPTRPILQRRERLDPEMREQAFRESTENLLQELDAVEDEIFKEQN